MINPLHLNAKCEQWLRLGCAKTQAFSLSKMLEPLILEWAFSLIDEPQTWTRQKEWRCPRLARRQLLV